MFIYDDSVEQNVFCAIWYRKNKGKQIADVIYADEWQFYAVESGNLIEREDPKQLFFTECPVVDYNTQVIGEKSPFHQVIPYIDALDWVITGNSNEVERLVDALLVLGTTVKKEDLDHMDEWKALQNMKKDDKAEYLTKDMSPAFREYVSKLLIQEIHKHGHVVDWYNPDTGLSGAASGKALQTRMFDMDMYSRRIEKVYKSGINKRMRLIGELLSKQSVPVAPVEVVFMRDTINDYESKIDALNKAAFLSSQTKIEESGFNYAEEKERLDKEAEERMIGYGEIDGDENGVSGVALDAIEDAPAIALNGAQIQAAQAVALAVSSGEMPRSNGVELVVSMGVPRDQAEKIVPAEGKKKAE
jgi:SPP1 family phage portal protein